MWPGCVDAGQHAGTLQLVAQVTVEVSNATRVQIHHRHVSKVRSPWEVAAQHKHCNRHTLGAQGSAARRGDMLDVPTCHTDQQQSTTNPPLLLLPHLLLLLPRPSFYFKNNLLELIYFLKLFEVKNRLAV